MVPSRLSLRRHFARLKDPRVMGRTRHRLIDILVIAVCAVICGAKDWQQIETFARHRQAWLRRFLALPNGVPAHDTYERLFDRIAPQTFQECLLSWLQEVSHSLGLHVAIDGKTLCGSANGRSALGPLHIVSAWATECHLSLGQVAVDSKSNEITAIPKLLELLDLQGALVTIDAMGCQKRIAADILKGGGDYVLAVKDNQPKLLEDIQHCFAQGLESNFAGLDHDIHATTDHGHGRTERRIYTIIRQPAGIRAADAWEGLHVIGMCFRSRTVHGETSEEAHYFIGSLRGSAERYGQALRGHWGIENHLHWQLEVSFGEDNCRVQRRNGAENLSIVRRLALALLKRHADKRSIAGKQFAAALDTGFLEEILDGATTLEKF
jgi:predicted transposase YbfD/YdcC